MSPPGKECARDRGRKVRQVLLARPCRLFGKAGSPEKYPAVNQPFEMDEAQWYAMRVFYNRIGRIKEELDGLGAQTYMALRTVDRIVDGKLVYEEVQLAPSLLFVRWTLPCLMAFKQRHFSDLMLYRDAAGSGPAPIRDEEMKLFIFVTSADRGRNVEYLGEHFDFKVGERVRVTDGIYKGAEGVIKRIKKDRKLLVSVEGVAVVAVSHIPQQYLEKIV